MFTMSSTMPLWSMRGTNSVNWHVRRWEKNIERWSFRSYPQRKILRNGHLRLCIHTYVRFMETNCDWWRCIAGKPRNPQRHGDPQRNLRRWSFCQFGSPELNSNAVVASTKAPMTRVDSSLEGVPLSNVRFSVCSMDFIFSGDRK